MCTDVDVGIEKNVIYSVIIVVATSKINVITVVKIMFKSTVLIAVK